MKRILVVDDEPDYCANLADILHDYGYYVDTCTNPEDALRKSAEIGYELALIDFRMPRMNGVELMLELKKEQPNIVGMLVTAYAGVDTTESANSAGFRQIIPKPVDIPDLLEAIGPSDS